MAGDALAESEVHAVGVVDEQPDLARRDLLGEQHLDLRLGGRETALDVVLYVLHSQFWP